MICDFFHSHHKPNPNTSIPCDPPLAVSNSNMNSDEIEQAFGDACCEIKSNESPMTRLQLSCHATLMPSDLRQMTCQI